MRINTKLPTNFHLNAFRETGLRVIGAALLLLSLLPGCQTQKRFNDGFCSVGSEEVNTIMAHWARTFAEQNRLSAEPVHEGRGNLVAPDALLREVCDLAPMSLPMPDSQIHAFIMKYKAPPVAVPIAIDAMAIIVHPDVPVAELTYADIQAIYSRPNATLDNGYQFQKVYGINTATTRIQWFRREFLNTRRESDHVVELSGPLALVDRIAATENSIGYARPEETVGTDVRLVSLGRAARNGQPAIAPVAPTPDEIRLGRYPLKRYYYIYLPPIERELPINAQAIAFARYMLSDAAQAMLRPVGLYPVNPEARRNALDTLAGYAQNTLQN
ncbi:MAG: hypothetical protein KDK30_01290 [Leptospiraceae bacterium]|nr:hypothetical protein [Leptospiraceae bacterium]MCB1316520.1 hypothetical protein [Leptospiraceae bacterium]MCB1322997.1 hypothetical protein [Leptospiraceae bacterium]